MLSFPTLKTFYYIILDCNYPSNNVKYDWSGWDLFIWMWKSTIILCLKMINKNMRKKSVK